MGYIAPIPQYQYSQYCERSIPDRHDPIPLTPVQKAALTTTTFQDTLKGKITVMKRQKKKRSTAKSSLKKNEYDLFEAAEITGKGTKIQEFI